MVDDHEGLEDDLDMIPNAFDLLLIWLGSTLKRRTAYCSKVMVGICRMHLLLYSCKCLVRS